MDLQKAPRFPGGFLYDRAVLGFYTGTPFEQHGHKRVRYGRRWLCADYAKSGRGDVELFRSVAHFCEVHAPAHIAFHRTYALGDILMLLPVCRAFARHYPSIRRVTICCGDFCDKLSGLHKTQDLVRFSTVRGDVNHYDAGADVHYDLNSCLEVDHWGGPESKIHRVNLYLRALGVWNES